MKRLIFTIVVLGVLNVMCQAQGYETNAEQQTTGFEWPEGKKMALTLTFDDARLSEIDKGIPLLDKYGVNATFYVSPSNLLKRLDRWKQAVQNGHEVGNHSLVHPCSGNFDWSRKNALEDYTPRAMKKELKSANDLIEEKLSIRPVSFAYPCGETYVSRGVKTKSYVPVVAKMFETGRTWLDEAPNDPLYCNMAQLTGMRMDQKSFDEILQLIEEAKKKGQWLILAGHEMDENQNYHTTLLSTLEEICRYASDPANGIWIGTVHEIASYIKKERREIPASE